VPVSLLTAAYTARQARSAANRTPAANVRIPWFIALFLAATIVSTYLPRFTAEYAAASHLGRTGLTATLFLIGTSLSKRTLQQVGVRPLLQGIVLWVVVASLSLAAIYTHLISI
jgi:uncharacterized membrane protein YadS